MAVSRIEPIIQRLRKIALRQDVAGMTDGQLLENFVNNHDAAAFEALVRRHGPMVWGVCHRLLRNRHDVEDAYQATFLVLARKAASVSPREMVGNWLYGVAHTTALRAKVGTAKQRVRERQVMDMPELAPAETGLPEDLQTLLDQELSRLPDKYRIAIVLCDLEARTRKEVAQQLKVPEGTLSSRLTTGRRMLAKRLARHGLPFSAGAVATMLSQSAVSACVPAALVGTTVNAAISVAAGQAAATGAISVKVAALTEGVLKTMLMTKLKIAMAMAVLFVATTVALVCGMVAGQPQPGLPDDVKAKPQSKPAEPPKEDKDKLQGTWRLVTAENDGVRIGEGRPEIKDTRLVFEKSSVTFFSKLFHSPNVPLEPEDVKYVGAFTLDTKKNPKEIVLTLETNPWNDKKDLTIRGIYALDGDSLNLCLSLPTEDKQVLPREFSANFGSKRVLWTFKREPAAEKGGEKKTGLELNNQVALAEKQVAIKRAALKAAQAQQKIAVEKLASLRAQVAQAQASESFAETQVKRIEELVKQQAVAAALVDERRLQWEAAKVGRTAAESKVVECEAQVLLEEARVQLAQLEVQEAEVRLKQLKARLERKR